MKRNEGTKSNFSIRYGRISVTLGSGIAGFNNQHTSAIAELCLIFSLIFFRFYVSVPTLVGSLGCEYDQQAISQLLVAIWSPFSSRLMASCLPFASRLLNNAVTR